MNAGPDPLIILDISRLISAAGAAAPTGVDRVEMAYARALLRLAPARVRFATVRPPGLPMRLDSEAVRGFLDALSRRWEVGGAGSSLAVWSAVARLVRGAWRERPQPQREAVYVIASHRHLDREALVRRIVRAERARLVALVHDLIPIETPEYARASSAVRHARRIRTLSRCADGIVTVSEATRARLTPHLTQARRPIAVRVAHLGLDPNPAVAPAGRAPPKPYFVVLGTIEPRKNHLLLLNLWRAMAQALGPEATPDLHVLGRRGWENENIVDMLERCPPLQGLVHERSKAPDVQVRRLIAGARAVLMPSFAEGFGLPVAEAMQLGTPVICSDIPALREAGQDIAEYLDPLDGPAWREAVLDYARDGSVRRAAQIDRIRNWRPPLWDEHIEVLLDLAQTVSA